MAKRIPLTRQQEMRAYTDALGAICICLSAQLDGARLVADLKRLADYAASAGHGPSAGILDTLVDVLTEGKHAGATYDH